MRQEIQARQLIRLRNMGRTDGMAMTDLDLDAIERDHAGEPDIASLCELVKEQRAVIDAQREVTNQRISDQRLEIESWKQTAAALREDLRKIQAPSSWPGSVAYDAAVRGEQA